MTPEEQERYDWEVMHGSIQKIKETVGRLNPKTHFKTGKELIEFVFSLATGVSIFIVYILIYQRIGFEYAVLTMLMLSLSVLLSINKRVGEHEKETKQ